MNASWPRRHPWSTGVVLLVVVVLVAAASRWATTGDHEAPGAARGPGGSAFYEPTASEVAAGGHGTVIWSRPLPSASSDAGRSHLVLYRSTGAKGGTVPVSGVVTVPEGEPPRGGWPIVSWGHGTTGMADACAPSRTGVDDETGAYVPVAEDATADLVDKGYAVVRTDYEGLGTPGPHPFLLGRSSGAAMSDIVLAARDLEPDLSHRWVAIGHSQGAQAALFTSRFAGAYTPGVELVGVVALAPPSQLGSTLERVSRPRSAQHQGGEDRTTASSIFFGPLVLAAARTAGGDASRVLTREGRALAPHLEERCLAGLARPDSLGGIAPRDFLSEGADHPDIHEVVESNDAAALDPQAPLLVAQGGKDTAVPRGQTDRLVEQLEGRGADVDHVTVAGADHMSILGRTASRMNAWVEEAFAG